VKYVAVLLSALLLMTACGTPPQERFFTLTSEPPSPASFNSTSPAFVVVVGPVTVPDVVDRPQLVLRTSPSRVEIAEQARWAAPLKNEIARVVADHLAQLLPGAHTATSAERASGTPDYRVLIDVQRFESTPQEGATVQASWTVRNRDGSALNGRSLVSEPAGAGYDALVAAHSRALAAVSRDIAAAIRPTREQKR
jgi:uncharacterized lipoprotein YmbA